MAEFEDGKDESALRTIGEVSEALAIKPHVLRYWEQQFSLLKPLKRSGGRRYYRAEDVVVVKHINRLVNEEGYTLKGAQAVLRTIGKDGSDRQGVERRSGERRAMVDEGETAGGAIKDTPEASEAVDHSGTITRLKTIRARLAKAIAA